MFKLFCPMRRSRVSEAISNLKPLTNQKPSLIEYKYSDFMQGGHNHQIFSHDAQMQYLFACFKNGKWIEPSLGDGPSERRVI